MNNGLTFTATGSPLIAGIVMGIMETHSMGLILI